MEKGILLISGGIDSPVAGHMLKKKFDVICVHFSSEIFAGEESIKKSKATAKEIGLDKLYVADVSEELLKISKEAKTDLYFVLMKRFMNKVAAKLAEEEEAVFIATGENLAQVSSQTLQNMMVVDKSVEIPILRPLMTFEKQEIVDKAKEIGTYDISTGPEHCDALGPDHPETAANLEEVVSEEDKIGMDSLVEDAFSKISVSDL